MNIMKKKNIQNNSNTVKSVNFENMTFWDNFSIFIEYGILRKYEYFTTKTLVKSFHHSHNLIENFSFFH